MYFVTIRTISLIPTFGCVKYLTFEDIKEADAWFKGNYTDGSPICENYKIEYAGTDYEKAMKLCSTYRAKLASLDAHIKKIGKILIALEEKEANETN